MSKTTKVCDCFLDVAIYCLFSIEDLCCAEFFNLCLQAKSQKRNSLMICHFLSMKDNSDRDECYIACCTHFVNSELEDPSKLEGIDPPLTRNCFCYSDDDNCLTCVNANFGSKKQDINTFCFCCQREILQNFSSKLYLIKNGDGEVSRLLLSF